METTSQSLIRQLTKDFFILPNEQKSVKIKIFGPIMIEKKYGKYFPGYRNLSVISTLSFLTNNWEFVFKRFDTRKSS